MTCRSNWLLLTRGALLIPACSFIKHHSIFRRAERAQTAPHSRIHLFGNLELTLPLKHTYIKLVSSYRKTHSSTWSCQANEMSTSNVAGKQGCPTCGEMDRSDLAAKVWVASSHSPFFPYSKGTKTKGESGANLTLSRNFFQIRKILSLPTLLPPLGNWHNKYAYLGRLKCNCASLGLCSAQLEQLYAASPGVREDNRCCRKCSRMRIRSLCCSPQLDFSLSKVGEPF